jgi:hypothetical protein
VNRIIAEVGTDMRFIDDSGLGNLTTMGEVPMLSPRSRDADDDDDAAHETHTVRAPPARLGHKTYVCFPSEPWRC